MSLVPDSPCPDLGAGLTGRPDLKAEHRPGYLGLPAMSGSAFGPLLELLQRTCSEEQDEVRIEEPGEEEKEARLQGGV